jgi:hypothetical protein
MLGGCCCPQCRERRGRSRRKKGLEGRTREGGWRRTVYGREEMKSGEEMVVWGRGREHACWWGWRREVRHLERGEHETIELDSSYYIISYT